ncbi:hypothetical protein ACFO8O_12275 [Hephaestia sp. GCM10023244]|uniref:hypothetical protein n=1 Tax=unclassified Hephaestia TaxID=2631281 RepID=UPI0020772FA5|nr:hypothetical protein [Hephaestia sp. MAHUQ-44]MCM8731736.1 hypothetical protein [Hephaestia sp. MAHUQ-44]
MRIPMVMPILILPLGLVACGPSPDDPGLGGVTPDQARELNEAAAMLDANSVAINAVTNQDTSR